jgi:ParB family transcriptional regulator, chromosome partitioning protein
MPAMNTIEADLSSLEIRYDRLRLREAGPEKALLASLSEVGQQTPVMAIQDGARYVVIDGHKRVRALRKLKADQVRLAVWDLAEAEALAMSFRANAASPRSAFEDGWLIETLHHRFGWSLSEIGRKLLRSASWVSRRLSLIEEAPAWLMNRVQEGRIGAHAAAHHLLPLTRGKGDEARAFLENLAALAPTERQIREVAEAYRRSSPEAKRRIAADPGLFLKARSALEADPVLTDIESRCVKNLSLLGNVSLGLVKSLPEALATETAGAGREKIAAAWTQAEEKWALLRKTAAAVIEVPHA